MKADRNRTVSPEFIYKRTMEGEPRLSVLMEQYSKQLSEMCIRDSFRCDTRKLSLRLRFLQHLMKSIGVDVLSDTLLERTLDLLQKLYTEEVHFNE